MAKAEVKAKLDAALKSAVATPISATPASSEPVAQVVVEPVAPLETVEIKLSPEMAENVRPVLDQVEAALASAEPGESAASGSGQAEQEGTASFIGVDPGRPGSGHSAMMIGEHILVVTAPAGPRRRAGFGFGPEPVELRWDQLGATDEERKEKIEALRADPCLRLDGRIESHPFED